MRVKHRESGKEYKVYDVSKEKYGTYILIYKEQTTYETYIPYAGAIGKERIVKKAGWVWDDIDDYEPVQEQIYVSELKESKSCSEIIKRELDNIKKFKLFGKEVE